MIAKPTFPRPALDELCRRWRIRRLATFGSVLRDDFREDSDIDLLVEFESSAVPGLLGLESLRRELSALLGGRAVDLVTRGGLHPRLRDHILADAVEQYAA